MDPLSRLRRDYAAAFLGYLTQRNETGLRTAYELGRRAMANPVGMLDLVRVHHEVFLDVATTVGGATELRDIGRAAADFLVEALASFQMTQRGYIENASQSRQPPPGGAAGAPPGP